MKMQYETGPSFKLNNLTTTGIRQDNAVFPKPTKYFQKSKTIFNSFTILYSNWIQVWCNMSLHMTGQIQ